MKFMIYADKSLSRKLLKTLSQWDSNEQITLEIDTGVIYKVLPLEEYIRVTNDKYLKHLTQANTNRRIQWKQIESRWYNKYCRQRAS